MIKKDIAILLGIVLLCAVTWYYLAVWIPFKAELNYLKMELERSFDEERIALYKSKIRMHYRKCIPILRWFC